MVKRNSFAAFVYYCGRICGIKERRRGISQGADQCGTGWTKPGVHLILATQKPEGTVDENIWSNSRFRICLRVQDSKDSMYMLHKSDAAYLTQTGRAYLQVGNNEIYELFQSGWSGAVYEENDGINGSRAQMLDETGKAALVGNYAKEETARMLYIWRKSSDSVDCNSQISVSDSEERRLSQTTAIVASCFAGEHYIGKT